MCSICSATFNTPASVWPKPSLAVSTPVKWLHGDHFGFPIVSPDNIPSLGPKSDQDRGQSIPPYHPRPHNAPSRAIGPASRSFGVALQAARLQLPVGKIALPLKFTRSAIGKPLLPDTIQEKRAPASWWCPSDGRLLAFARLPPQPLRQSFICGISATHRPTVRNALPEFSSRGKPWPRESRQACIEI